MILFHPSFQTGKYHMSVLLYRGSFTRWRKTNAAGYFFNCFPCCRCTIVRIIMQVHLSVDESYCQARSRLFWQRRRAVQRLLGNSRPFSLMPKQIASRLASSRRARGETSGGGGGSTAANWDAAQGWRLMNGGRWNYVGQGRPTGGWETHEGSEWSIP